MVKSQFEAMNSCWVGHAGEMFDVGVPWLRVIKDFYLSFMWPMRRGLTVHIRTQHKLSPAPLVYSSTCVPS